MTWPGSPKDKHFEGFTGREGLPTVFAQPHGGGADASISRVLPMTGNEQAVNELDRFYASGQRIDIHDVQRALSESDAWWSAVFETAGIGILFGDVTGRILAVTPVLEKMLGYAQEEIIALGPAGITHPDDVQSDVELFMELVRGQRERYQLEKRYLRKDGSVMWGHLTAILLRDRTGEPRFGLAIVEDITARKRADIYQERLAQAAERRQQAIEINDSIMQGLVVTKWALDAGDTDLANESLASSLEAVRNRIQSLFEDERSTQASLRSEAASGTYEVDLR